MARVHGKNADFSFNGVQIEDELATITLNCTVPEAEITAFSDAYQNYLAGKPAYAYEMNGSLDTAAAQGHKTLFAALGAGPKTTIFSPDAGVTLFTNTLSGIAGTYITRYGISLPVGDAAKYNLSLQASGTVGRTQP